MGAEWPFMAAAVPLVYLRWHVHRWYRTAIIAEVEAEIHVASLLLVWHPRKFRHCSFRAIIRQSIRMVALGIYACVLDGLVSLFLSPKWCVSERAVFHYVPRSFASFLV